MLIPLAPPFFLPFPPLPPRPPLTPSTSSFIVPREMVSKEGVRKGRGRGKERERKGEGEERGGWGGDGREADRQEDEQSQLVSHVLLSRGCLELYRLDSSAPGGITHVHANKYTWTICPLFLKWRLPICRNFTHATVGAGQWRR